MSYPPSPTGYEIPKPSAFSRNPNRNLLIVGGLVLFICIGICMCLALGGNFINNFTNEQESIGTVIDDFMKLMVERDTETAYSLFSRRVQKQIEISELEKMIQGKNYVLFEGYQSVEITNINLSTAVNTDQNLPQGRVATVTGIVHYSGNISGKFDAVLEKEGETWRLHNIYITVPPDKIAP